MLLYLIQENPNYILGDLKLRLSENITELSGANCYSPSKNTFPFLNLTARQLVEAIVVYDEETNYSRDQIKNLVIQATEMKLPFFEGSFLELGNTICLIYEDTKKNHELQLLDYCADNNSYILLEGLAKPGISYSDKVDSIVSRLLKIGSNGHELTIVDPYIFPRHYDSDYDNLFLDIIKNSGVSSVKIITYRNSCNTTIRALIESQLSIPITVYDADTYPDHDRYWIIEDSEKAINMGTSLNGLGLKLSTLTILTKTDTRELLNELSVITNTF